MPNHIIISNTDNNYICQIIVKYIFCSILIHLHSINNVLTKLRFKIYIRLSYYTNYLQQKKKHSNIKATK